MKVNQWMSTISLVALCTVQGCTTPQAEVRADFLGDPAAVTPILRTITILPNTSSVNVKSGDIIEFVVGDHAFAWNFNGTVSSFDLDRVAPAGVLDHHVIAYVAVNPEDMGGDGHHHGGRH